MKLIVISHNKFLDNEDHLLNQMFENGLKYFHYRKYSSSKEGATTFFKKILPEYHNRIIIHSHFELMEEFDLMGIHLNEKNRVNILLKPNHKIISTSFHDFTVLKTVLSQFEYIFFSPVFNSISKPGHNPIYTEQEIKDGLKNINNKVIALGGLSERNLNSIYKMGFKGAAFLGYIWQNSEPLKTFMNIKNKMEQL